MNHTLNSSLAYAGMGYAVLPIKERAKIPLVSHGLKDATTDERLIRAWWDRWPNANVAIRCDRLAVIDIDPGAIWPNEKLREAIRAVRPALQRTPRGGWHIIFRLPDGKNWRPRAGRIAEHVDTRCGPGCYLMVAPSVTEQGQYRWIRPLRLAETLPPPPEILIQVLDSLEDRSPSKPFHADPWSSCSDIPEGCRNTQLARLAGRLRYVGLDKQEIENVLLTINSLRCRPPLPEAEVRRIAKSIGQYPPGSDFSMAMSKAWAKAITHRRKRYVRRYPV